MPGLRRFWGSSLFFVAGFNVFRLTFLFIRIPRFIALRHRDLLHFFDSGRRGAIPTYGCTADNPSAHVACFAKKSGNSKDKISPEPEIICPHVGVDVVGHEKAGKEEPCHEIKQLRK